MSDLSVNKSVEHKTAAFKVGASFDAGARGGDSAVGGSINAGFELMKAEGPGDIGLNLAMAFGIHSIARSYFQPAGPEHDDSCWDECWDPLMETCGCNGPTDGYYVDPQYSQSSYEWRDLSLRAMFAPELEVGIARLGPGLLAVGLSPQFGADFLKPEKNHGADESSMVFLVSSGLKYRMDTGLEVMAGAKVDLANDAEAFSMHDRSVMANIGVGYTF